MAGFKKLEYVELELGLQSYNVKIYFGCTVGIRLPNKDSFRMVCV